MTAIIDIHGREILDSRGNPTVEVDVSARRRQLRPRRGSQRAPAPARTRRSNCATATSARYLGKGVHQGGRRGQRRESASCCSEFDAEDQRDIDLAMIELDGSANKGRLGANAILGASLAVAKAAADARGLPLYSYVGGVSAHVLPVPMMNIVNGGEHADNPIDIQEFMVMPVGAPTLAEAVRWGSEIFHTLKKALHDKGLATAVGDEGGFAPNLASTRAALDFIMGSIEQAGFKPGEDVVLALDCAATEYFRGGKYEMTGEGISLSPEGNGGLSRRPVRRLSDPLDRGRHERGRFRRLEGPHRRHRRTVQLVGDDLFVTNPAPARDGHRQGAGQFAAGQGQPDRHADRDAGGGRAWRSARATPR